ncbi:MAG: NAD(P)-dependent alcohol dehydrogenase [Nitrospinales bacterium]
MKAFEIQGDFGLDCLKEVEKPEPQPGPGEILLQVRAASLNYRDLLTVEGRYNPHQPLPLVPLSDGIGEVLATGEGVSRVKTGDRVAGIFAQKWLAGTPSNSMLQSTLGGPLDGMLTERIVLHEDGLVHVPDHLTDEQAAALPCAGVTAWNALVTEGGLKAGQSVLIQGTGGVSIFALQFTRMFGARAIVISAHEEKLARAKNLGANEVIHSRAVPDWDKKVLELTDGLGVDHVVEVGGAATLQKSLHSVRFGGRISLIGILSGIETQVNIISVLMKRVRVQGIYVGHRESFEAMNRAIRVSRLVPAVDRAFSFPEAIDAFRHMKSGKHFGKICIRMG